jgi:hypothetical protein
MKKVEDIRGRLSLAKAEAPAAFERAQYISNAERLAVFAWLSSLPARASGRRGDAGVVNGAMPNVPLTGRLS